MANEETKYWDENILKPFYPDNDELMTKKLKSRP